MPFSSIFSLCDWQRPSSFSKDLNLAPRTPKRGLMTTTLLASWYTVHSSVLYKHPYTYIHGNTHTRANILKKYFLSHYLPKKLYLVYSTSNNLFNAKEQFFTFKFHMRNYPFIILEPSLAELGKKSFL